jgi:hypothetical protein
VDGWIGAVPVPSWASRGALTGLVRRVLVGLERARGATEGADTGVTCDSRVAFSPDSWVAFSLDLKVPAPG